MPDGPIRTGINSRESTFRENMATLGDITPGLKAIASQTGAPGVSAFSDIPSVGALANMQAVSQNTSQSRANQANALINSLPQYTKGYRSYLKWRYPSRYGGGTSGTYPIYTGGGQGANSGGINITLPPLTEVP